MSRIPGTKLRNRCLLTSTGVEAIDTLLGGGATSTSILAVDEVTGGGGGGKSTSAIVRCFLAEGLHEGQNIFIASPFTNEAEEVLRQLPQKTAATTALDPTKKATTSNAGLQIAWRYSLMREVDSYISRAGASFSSHKWDLSTHCDHSNNHERATIYAPGRGGAAYAKTWEQLRPLLSRPQYQAGDGKVTGGGGGFLRIVIIDVGSPLWTDSDEMVAMLIRLKAFSRFANCATLLTMDSSLLLAEGRHHLLRQVDALFRLEPTPKEEQKQISLFQKFDGQFIIEKLPTINSIAPHKPDCIDLVFALKRRHFEVKVLHLPPAISSGGGGGDEGAGGKKKGATAAMSCQRINEEF